MKAFETKKATTQAQYEKIMEGIQNSQKNGLTSHRISVISDCKEISDEAIEMIAKDGFDVEIHYMDEYKELIIISWKNSEEGRNGVITKYVAHTQKAMPAPQKKSFWEFLDDLFIGPSDDGHY